MRQLSKGTVICWVSIFTDTVVELGVVVKRLETLTYGTESRWYEFGFGQPATKNSLCQPCSKLIQFSNQERIM